MALRGLSRLTQLWTQTEDSSRPTFPEPVTPRVATRPSLCFVPGGAKTPSTSDSTSTPLKMSSWDASSWKTRVKANFSTALRLESAGGDTTMCVGALLALSKNGSSTARYRSAVVAGSKLVVDETPALDADGLRRR